MVSFPNLFQAILSAETALADSTTPGGAKPSIPEYFVIHSTAGVLSETAIEEYKTKKWRGKAHRYIMKDGSTKELWPFSERLVFATKAEKQNPKLKGLMLHIEVVYGSGESPTEAQYAALADAYKEAYDQFGELTIVPHKEIDRGIPDGHSDPTNFDFGKLTRLVNERLAAPLSKNSCITQSRYEVPNQADQINVWPPQLDGKPSRFKASTDL